MLKHIILPKQRLINILTRGLQIVGKLKKFISTLLDFGFEIWREIALNASP